MSSTNVAIAVILSAWDQRFISNLNDPADDRAGLGDGVGDGGGAAAS
jgi:hypothetical protein